MLGAAGAGEDGRSAILSGHGAPHVNIQIEAKTANVPQPNAVAFSFLDAMPAAAGAGEGESAISPAQGSACVNVVADARNTDVLLPGASPSSFVDPILQVAGADKLGESGPGYTAAHSMNAIAPERGKVEAKTEHPHGKKEAKESGDRPQLSFPSTLLQSAVVSGMQAAPDAPRTPAPFATVSAAEGCSQPAIESIPAAVITTSSGAGEAGGFRAVVPPHERLVSVASRAATQPGAQDAASGSASSAPSDGAATGAPNGGESLDESTVGEPSKSGSGAHAANAGIVNRSHPTLAPPDAEPQPQPADAAHAAQQTESPDAANDAQQTEHAITAAQVSADYVALLQGILTQSAGNTEALSPQEPSTDAQSSLSARSNGRAASDAAAGNMRSVSQTAVAAFSRIAASAGAIDQVALPIAKGGEVNTNAPVGKADGSKLAKGEKDSAGAAPDAKQHTAVMPAHDARSDGAGAVQPVNATQGPTMDGAQNAPATAASTAGQVVVAHPQSAAHAPASGHPVSGFEVLARAQESEAGSAAIQAHVPVAVKSARLIQRMGEAEIRVGMRSSDFGDVSISTAVGRNSISAQISLDHADLAKAIAAHLPEVQARLGSSQSVDVRISTTQQTAGQIGYAPGEMARQSEGQGHEYSGRQQSSGQRAGAVERSLETVSLPAAMMENSFHQGRLDIRA